MRDSLHEIRALIFDFGGVLARTESQKPREELARQVGLSPQQLYEAVFNGEESRLAQLGRMSLEEHWQRIGQVLGIDSSQELVEFRRRFFEGDVLDAELVGHIQRMRGRYKTALLSNASPQLTELLETLRVTDAFDVIVISGLVGVQKPDPAIYHILLERLGLSPEETIFVDDFVENVEAARELGMDTLHFRVGMDWREELERRLAA